MRRLASTTGAVCAEEPSNLPLIHVAKAAATRMQHHDLHRPMQASLRRFRRRARERMILRPDLRQTNRLAAITTRASVVNLERPMTRLVERHCEESRGKILRRARPFVSVDCRGFGDGGGDDAFDPCRSFRLCLRLTPRQVIRRGKGQCKRKKPNEYCHDYLVKEGNVAEPSSPVWQRPISPAACHRKTPRPLRMSFRGSRTYICATWRLGHVTCRVITKSS